eukprot:9276483-Lingulodinium_polyedra.AAC.1
MSSGNAIARPTPRNALTVAPRGVPDNDALGGLAFSTPAPALPSLSRTGCGLRHPRHLRAS